MTTPVKKVTNRKKLSFRINVMISVVVAVVITCLVLFNALELRVVMYDFYENQANIGSSLLENSIDGHDDVFTNDHTDLLDSLKESTDMEYTIFKGDTRLYTTLFIDGERAVDSTLDSSISSQVLAGDHFIGESTVLDVLYLSSYVPLHDENGDVVGILSAAVRVDKINPQITENALFSAVIGFFLLVGALTFSMFYIRRNITTRLKNVVIAADSIAKGEFDFVLKKTQEDEIGFLADSFLAMSDNITAIRGDMMKNLGEASSGNWNISPASEDVYVGGWIELRKSMVQMIQSVNDALLQVAISSEQISFGATQVASGSQILAQGSIQQAGSIQSLSTTVDAIHKQIEEGSKHSQLAKSATQKANDAIITSNQQMLEMIDSMKAIDNKSNEISKIIKTIDDIAFQTNILALNAAVEAARAGSAGEGFSVVADEVRNLATKSARSAKETAALIDETQIVITKGGKITDATAKSLLTVTEMIDEMVDFVNHIAALSNEQVSSITSINENTEQISSIIVSNSASAEESAATNEELSSQANLMKDLVAHFNLKK